MRCRTNHLRESTQLHLHRVPRERSGHRECRRKDFGERTRYCVSRTDETMIKEYIRDQEKDERDLERFRTHHKNGHLPIHRLCRC